jgi:hypothetical protein
MKANNATVTVKLEGDTLNMLQEAAKANGCTIAQATRFLIDYGQGNLCDWSNRGYPMFDIEREAKRGLAQLQSLR